MLNRLSEYWGRTKKELEMKFPNESVRLHLYNDILRTKGLFCSSANIVGRTAINGGRQCDFLQCDNKVSECFKALDYPSFVRMFSSSGQVIFMI